MTEALPARVGRYEIRGELGRGMMGVVYEAHDPALGRAIALKTIQLAFALSPDEREAFERRFMAEARIAAALSHPGIVIVHDVGRDVESGTLYIALERLQGRTLAERIADKKPLEWREALGLAGRVAEALHHAHAQGVVHRDIKPANIMILPSGEPKIMDFGIAKVPTSQLTLEGQVFGTPSYMSPEQALGGLVDARSDLFSLGTVLYQLLTGRKAFPGDSVPRIVALVVQQDPPPPSHVVRTLAPEIDYLAARALAKIPAHRYPDGKAMAEDMDDILAGRSPRHRATWKSPRRAEGTLVSMPTFAPEDQISSVLDAAARVAPPRPVGRRAVRPLFLAVALGALLVPVALLLRRDQETVTPPASLSTPPAAVAPQPSPAEPSAVAPSLEASPAALPMTTPEPVSVGPTTTPKAPPSRAPRATPAAPVPTQAVPLAPRAPPPPLPATALAQLAFDFEHSLKSGTLRVLIDNKLVLERDLEGRVTKEVIGLKIRKGRIEKVLSVSPGNHEVRVQVAWEDDHKEEMLSGTFKAGATRQLEIRLGRIRKNLSLKWK